MWLGSSLLATLLTEFEGVLDRMLCQEVINLLHDIIEFSLELVSLRLARLV